MFIVNMKQLEVAPCIVHTITASLVIRTVFRRVGYQIRNITCSYVFEAVFTKVFMHG